MSNSISPGGDFAAIGCLSCVANYGAGGKDTCTLTFAKSSTAASDFTDDAEATVTVDGGTLFTGIVSKPGRAARGTGEYHTVTLVTKWRRLEEIPFTQLYATGVSGTARKSRVMIGVNLSGTRMTTAEIIAEVLAFANSEGAGIPLGSILPGETLYPPVAEFTDVTCAEVIRSTLRWHPDAMVFFNHADGKINILRQGSLTAVSRVAGAADLAVEATVYPRGDMILRGVQIHYETTTTVDGVDYNAITTDGAGASTGARVVHLTIPLQGANVTTQSQVIETRDIPTSAADAGLRVWLTDHFPELKAAALGAGQFVATDPVQVVHTDEEVGPGTTLSTYPRELLKGQIQDFMTGISACPVTVKIKLKFTGPASANPALYKLFPKPEKIETFAVTLMGTDALDQTYSNVESVGGETAPEGLAAAYFSAFTSVVEEGTFARVGAPDLSLRPGAKLTLSGRVTATGAPIQSCSIDVFSGRTACQFGPLTAALNPSDWVELLRAGQRTRKPTSRPYNSRSTAAKSAAQNIKGATGGRLHNSTRTSGVPDQAFFHCSAAASGSISIAAGAVLSTAWPATISDSTPVPDSIVKQTAITAQTVTAGAGSKIWLKGTFTKKDYAPSGALTGGVSVSITGGAGGGGGAGGAGGAGGSGGQGGSGGTGGSGGKGGSGGGGTGDGAGGSATPGLTGVDGLNGAFGTAGAYGAAGSAGGTGGTGNAGSTGSVATFTRYTTATLKVSVWELTSLSYEVVTTTPPTPSATAGYALIAEIETGSDGELVIKQRHSGLVSMPGTVAVAFPPP